MTKPPTSPGRVDFPQNHRGRACPVRCPGPACGVRFHIFFSGFAVIGLGLAARRVLASAEAANLLVGALTLGGALVIGGLFSLKMKWHGIAGAGVVALMGFARGLGNIPDLVGLWAGDRSRGGAPLIELGVTLICLMLVLRTVAALMRERARRLMNDG